MLPRLKYHLRRMNQESSRWWLTIPIVFTLVVLTVAGLFLTSLGDRESSPDGIALRVTRETGIRSQTLEGIGLSTHKSLSPNLLQEGSFDELTFRKTLQARYLGNGSFSLYSLDQEPEIYKGPGLPLDQSLSLFEGGSISFDRLEQGRLHTLGRGIVRSGQDDQILEETVLPNIGVPRWSTIAARYSEDHQLVETMVVLEDGRVAVNVHSELSQVLPGRPPRDIGGLFYVDKRPQAWTRHGAVYEYVSEAKQWSLVLESIALDQEIHDLIPLDVERYFAASEDGFYVSDQQAWEVMTAPEVSEGRWEIARRGETLYALRDGKLFANLPPWIDFKDGLVYEEASIFLPSEHRWLNVFEGSTSAHLMEDPDGELLIIDSAVSHWHVLRDLRLESEDLFLEDSPYALTHDAALQGDLPTNIDYLEPIGRGRLLARNTNGTFLLSASYPKGSRFFLDNAASYIPLNDMSLLEVSEEVIKRIQLTSTVKVDYAEAIGFGEMYLTTLEKQLPPTTYENMGGQYPWTISAGSHRYEVQATQADSVLEEVASHQLVLFPEDGKSEVKQSIDLASGINGGELMTFSFRAGSESGQEPQRLRLTLSGPFRTYALQSERIRGPLRSYSMSFRLPEFQIDREATSIELSLQWESDAELILDDLALMVREGHDETGLAASLRHEIQELKPRRLRFSLGENLEFSDQAYAGLNNKPFRTRLNQIIQTCDLLGVEPWIVIPSDWTAEEHAELFQYLAANINDSLGRQRLEDGWGQAWLRRLPRVYLEISAGSEDTHDDLLYAARVNQSIAAMTQSSSYDAVKNQVVFLDGLEYGGGRMLSDADGHAKTIDLIDFERQIPADQNLKKDSILDLYYAETPRLSDDAEPWIASLQDSGSETDITQVIATILEWMNQGIAVNLDQTSLLPVEFSEALIASDTLSKKDADRLLLWTRFNELTQGRRMQVSFDTESAILAAEDLTLLAIESGNEIRLIVAANANSERMNIEFNLDPFEPEQMRLHRFDREGRLYEDRDSKRPDSTFTLVPGDILFVAFSSEK